MFSSVCLFVLIFIVWCVRYNWRMRRLIKMVNKFNGPPALPFFGNIFQLSGDPMSIIQQGLRMQQTYKKPFRIWMLNRPYIIISKAEDAQIVADKALEKDISYRFIVDMLGDGIFTSKVKKWRMHRQLVKSAFNPIILSKYFLKVFNNQNSRLIQRLNKEVNSGQYFNLWPYISSTSIDTISETALGREEEFPESRIDEFGRAVVKSADIVCYRIIRPWLHPSAIFAIYKYFKGYDKIFKIVHELPLQILNTQIRRWHEKKRQGITLADEDKKTFLGILFDSCDRQLLTDQQIKDEVISIMFGGSETTAVTNCFLLLMLAMRQDIQNKVYQEIHEVFGESDRAPTTEDLAKLNYLEQCIKETLRRYPVVPIISRHAEEDIELTDKQVIPAGANIILAILQIHQDPHTYQNPHEWNPSNFDPDKVANRHSCSFIPFSTGLRGCIGQKYAYVSMKTQISTIVRNFKLTTNVKMEDIQLSLDLIFRSRRGYQVKLEYRDKK